MKLGVFVVPDAGDAGLTVDTIVAADRSGLDVVGVQDHPYQRPLLRHVDAPRRTSAARTERVSLVPDVINLPLRLPSVLAKSAASLDLLSGGRGRAWPRVPAAFWEAIAAMGGPRRTPKEAVDALQEAVAVLRGFWFGQRSVDIEGENYRVRGAKPGPQPAHPIGIWIGAYGPRMLRLTGRLGDGWLPSLGERFMRPLDAPRMHAAVDEGAKAAGRDPAAIERVVNVMAVHGAPGNWADQLARIATELRFTTLLVAPPDADPVDFVRRLGEDVAPRLRERVG